MKCIHTCTGMRFLCCCRESTRDREQGTSEELEKEVVKGNVEKALLLCSLLCVCLREPQGISSRTVL